MLLIQKFSIGGRACSCSCPVVVILYWCFTDLHQDAIPITDSNTLYRLYLCWASSLLLMSLLSHSLISKAAGSDRD